VRCEEGEVWDPFFKKCRNVLCAEEGWRWAEGRCWPPDGLPTTTTTTTSTTTTSSSTTTTTESRTTTTETVSTSTTTIPTTTTPTTTTTEKTTTTSPTTTTTTTRKPGQIVFPTEPPKVVAVNFPKLISTTSTTTSTTTTTTSTTTTSTTTTTTSPSTTRRTEHRGGSVTSAINTSVSGAVLTPELLSCHQLLLLPSEFTRLANGSIYMPVYGRSLPPGHYRPGARQGVYICAPAFTRGQAKFSPIMGYVTFACLGVSLVCLLLHLLISLLAPELHNLSGKNLSSLSLALVGAYSSFLANMFVRELSAAHCFLLAVAMYYFYLSAFFWMLNIAVDVARTLKQATTELRLTSGAQWCRFAMYSLVGWGGPGLLATAAVLLDTLTLPWLPRDYTPRFGGSSIGICWLESRTALLLYFVAPSAVLLALNLALFLYSACLVWETTRSSAKITTSGPKTSFQLYLRLAVLMGVTWVAGLLAGGIDVETVWYVFLVLNTLQGLFILVFFTCSKKVVSSVRERLCGSGEGEAPPWKWSHPQTTLGSRDSQDSAASGSTVLSSSRVGAFHARSARTIYLVKDLFL